MLPPAKEDFDLANAMTNFVVQAVRKMDLSPWLPLRELSSWSDYADHTSAIRGRLQGFLSAKTKAVIHGVAHGGAVPGVEHAESARWFRALSTESNLLRWIACSDFHLLHDRFIDAKKPLPKGGRPLRTGYSRADEHLQPLLVPFRRHHGAQEPSARDFLTADPR